MVFISVARCVCVCVCQRYDEALTLVSEARRQYVTDECLAALYIPLLLDYRLGFNNHSTAIHVPATIAGQKPGKRRVTVTSTCSETVFVDVNVSQEKFCDVVTTKHECG